MGQLVKLRVDRRSAPFLPDENFLACAHFRIMAVFYRRRLPHYHPAGQPLFVTWRLHGSLPANRRFLRPTSSGKAFVAMDRILDCEKRGPLFLLRSDVASLVVDALQHRACILKHFQLHAWVVMPNHVHLLITPLIPVPKLMHSLKRFTAAGANRALNRSGRFWQDESYDRLVRNEHEFLKITHYIEMNPVAAQLSLTPEEFPWSSASRFGKSAADCQSAPHHPSTAL